MGHISKGLELLFITAIVASLIMIECGKALATNSAYFENTWTGITPFPPTYYGVSGAVAVDGKIYALAQIDTGQNLFKKYDPDKDTWTPLTPPNSWSWGSLVVCQNKIYLIGGGQIAQVYDPSTDRWENRSSTPKSLYAQLANAVDGKIYLISGLRPAAYGVWHPSEETYVYDTTNDSWSTMAPIPIPVGDYASTVLDGKIYIIGGGPAIVQSLIANATTLVQIFDPKTNKWTLGEPIPIGVAKAGACSTSGYYAPKRIYVVGGSTRVAIGRDVSLLEGSSFNQVFDPQTGKWSLATPTLENLPSLTLVNVNDALYAIRYGKTDAAEKYIPTGYKAYLLPTNVPSNSPSTTDSPVPAPPLQTIEIIAISSITAIAIASLLLFRRHRKVIPENKMDI